MLMPNKKKQPVEIVKIQVPVMQAGDGPAMECLIYNEDRSIEYIVGEDDKEVLEFIKEFMDGEYKKFAYVAITKDSLLKIVSEAPWQDW